MSTRYLVKQTATSIDQFLYEYRSMPLACYSAARASDHEAYDVVVEYDNDLSSRYVAMTYYINRLIYSLKAHMMDD